MGVTRAEEDYVPERDEADEKEDAEEVLGELQDDRTNAEELEEEAEHETEVRSDEVVRRAAVVDVVRDVLAKQPVDTARLAELAEHDREAIEFLQSIVEGRTKGGAFVYAEQRLAQLNLLLADLQPLLSVGLIEGLEGTMRDVIDGFESLRHELELLEEAQEVIIAGEPKKKGEDDKPDDDDGDDKPDEDDKPKSSLAEESSAAAAQQPEPGTATDATPGEEKKPGLWGRLWNRGKKDEGGGGGA